MNTNLTRHNMIMLFSLGLLGWALCGAIMFIGMEVAPLESTLVAHALGAPVIFSLISWVYFSKWSFTNPLQTAVIFILIVVIMDFFLVGLIINRSLEMFTSILGTWIPFTLIFFSTYLTGLRMEAHSGKQLMA